MSSISGISGTIDMMGILRLFEHAANDRNRGAAEIERILLTGIREHLRSGEVPAADLVRGADLLRRGQPCMANLRRISAMLERRPTAEELAAWSTSRINILSRLDEFFASHAAREINRRETLITISRSSAVFSAITGTARRGWKGRVFVLDGTPSGRGKDHAARLRETGLDAFSLPDGAILEAFDVPAGRLLVLCGADAIGPSRVINSQGTQVLAEIAGARSIARMLIADSHKDLPEEEFKVILDASPTADEGTGRSWPVFEAIPLELFDFRVNEYGIFPQGNRGSG